MSPTLLLGTVMCSVTIGSKQRRLGFLEHVAEGHRAGGFEGGFGAIDIVILAEVDFDADVLNLIAGDHAALQAFHKAFFHGGQKVVRNGAADDGIDPQEVVLFVVVKFAHVREMRSLVQNSAWIRVFGKREHADVDFAELAATAGLFFVAVTSLGLVLNGFAIGDFWLFDVDFDLVAAFEPFAQDHQVQFAHAGHHELFGLRIAVDAEAWGLPRRFCAGRRIAWLRRRGSWAWRPGRPSAWEI